MINSVIDAAEHYDFDTIKKFLEKGNNVNQLSSYQHLKHTIKLLKHKKLHRHIKPYNFD